MATKETSPTKKILILIVEGPSDETALQLIFEKLFYNNSIRVLPIHGDITADKGTNPSNIQNKICTQLKAISKVEHFKRHDCVGVLHLVDMDGTFIHGDCVVCNNEYSKAFYTLDNIQIDNPKKIVLRNKVKAENVKTLVNCSSMWEVPYSVCYMSCNLDHALFGKNNITETEKETYAYLFAEEYSKEDSNNVINTKFFALLESLMPQCLGTYKETWKFIEQDRNSLGRYSNLCLWVADNLNGEYAPYCKNITDKADKMESLNLL